MFTSLTLCLDLFALLVAWTFCKAYHLDALNYCYFPFNDGKLTINGVITTLVYLYIISLPEKSAPKKVMDIRMN